jgi:glycosyltransferase involved in cell wall biosynthesis
MRVLLVCEYATLNGGEQSMLSVLPWLQSSGIEFSAAAPARGDLSERLKKLNVPIFPIGESEDGPKLNRQQKIKLVHAAIEKTQPDLVHANSLSMSRIVGSARDSLPCRSVGHIRDIINLSAAAIGDVAKNDRVIAVSEATKSHFTVLGIPNSKIDVVYNGVDGELFRSRPTTKQIHRELSVPENTQFILLVGQLGMRKGTDDSLQAVSLVANEFPTVHVLVVGERHSQKDEAVEFERRLHVIANQPELVGRVHFLGRRSDIDVLMNESEILLHLAQQEPLGRVLLEAAASGCCVLASNVGGTSEIFPPSCFPETLVPKSAPHQAAKVLRVLLNDPAKTRETAARMSERIQTQFLSRQSANEIARIYHDTMKLNVNHGAL